MDSALKALIGLTCVAVLIAVGYFGWTEYSEASKAAAARETAELRRIAERQREEEERLAEGRRPCIAYLDGLRSYDLFENPNVEWSAEFLTLKVRDCLSAGLLTPQQTKEIQHRL